MQKAYWAATNIGPYVEGQVVLLEPDDGWVRTGRVYVRVDPATGQSGQG